LVVKYCFVTIQVMQLIDTNPEDAESSAEASATGKNALDAGRVEDLPPGSCQTVELPGGGELALYNINGEFYATENFCPHRGAPLTEGTLCEHVIECGLHGWQFDVRTGECLTVPEKIGTYEVVVEGGLVRIVI
jgi:nitrite reductase/ring-hydroxylating ferredoxin subunit